ncbi:hypothetical protein BD289DRAFT_461100 [Coniella lustricola]|uniref:Nudix hydrolase domain-containing protein n=1 Tax=Coniella lustricola TaxID=2025994 RepID=A0A2T3A6T4_9PEZI|nr:hypothetical protein BD289DRAFT_461100 [Coniella lustricola]
MSCLSFFLVCVDLLTNCHQTNQTWITTLTHSLSLQSQPSHPFHSNPYHLKSITIDSYSMFGQRIGFLKLTADISTSSSSGAFSSNTNNNNNNNQNESKLPGVIFLRGPAVGMLVVLIPDDSNPASASTSASETTLNDDDNEKEAYVVLTVQPRIAAGSLGFVELPAGMLDDESNFAGVAARELEEELGLVIKQDELVCLTDKVAEVKRAREKKEDDGGASMTSTNPQHETLPYAMYPSAGGCDEYIKIFAHEKRVARNTLHEWEGKYGGLRAQGEMITLKLVRLQDLWWEGGMDAKALAAVTMYQQLKRWERSGGGGSGSSDRGKGKI